VVVLTQRAMDCVSIERIGNLRDILRPFPSGPGAKWQISTAGKRFAALPMPEAAGQEKGSVHVTFLLNFFDELRRRMEMSVKPWHLCGLRVRSPALLIWYQGR
jgi:hypothetical protein